MSISPLSCAGAQIVTDFSDSEKSYRTFEMARSIVNFDIVIIVWDIQIHTVFILAIFFFQRITIDLWKKRKRKRKGKWIWNKWSEIKSNYKSIRVKYTKNSLDFYIVFRKGKKALCSFFLLYFFSLEKSVWLDK